MHKTPAIVLAVAAIWSISGAWAETHAGKQRCDQLLAYYDRYFAANREGAPAPGGLDKIIGQDECRKGNHAEGAQQLEIAIRKNGFFPPATPSSR